MTARVKPEQVLKHPCPICGQKANRSCLSTAGSKRGLPMVLNGRQRFHDERSELARAELPPTRTVERKASAKPHPWRGRAVLPAQGHHGSQR